MDDDAILACWTDYLRASGYRPRTLETHLTNLRALLRRSGKSVLSMTRYDLIADLGRHVDGQPLANSTKQHHKSLYFGFWSWMQDEGFRLDNPAVRLPKVIVRKPEANPVATEDLELLINSGIYAKTRMYALLYAYQGFRAAEIAVVSGESIDWRRRRILSVNGKGGKEVWRPIHPIVWTEAQKYPRADYWFPSPSGTGPITSRNVSTVLARAMKRAGITGHRPHNLRAWYATEQDRAGVPTTVIAAGLRHSNLRSMDRYVAVDLDRIAEAQARLPQVEVPTRTARPARRDSYLKHPTAPPDHCEERAAA